MYMKNIFREVLESVGGGSGAAMEVRFWDGDFFRLGHAPYSSSLSFQTRTALKRVLTEGSLGFGEEYMWSNIEIEGDLKPIIRLGLESRLGHPNRPLKTKIAALLLLRRTANRPSRSPRNIQRHYDLGNDFYRLWLDKSMTYSCAYFRDDSANLEQAQEDKYEHICRKLNLKQNESLVDIGCGWGGMLIHAAKHYGVTGVGCTLSPQQFDYATARIKEEKLENRISVRLEDYRSLQGCYDKFVSIGMFEHVGQKYSDVFMKRIRELLKPGGIGLLHTIAKDVPSETDPWMIKYIFPGGYIPVLPDVVRALCEQEFILKDIENLRLHYAMTLREWSRRFESAATDIEAMFDHQFVRMWRIYLNFSEASFRYGESRLYQFLFSHGTSDTYPRTRDHVYR
jgi:cyclopropane-fatty-acyl-phospholipid synthase